MVSMEIKIDVNDIPRLALAAQSISETVIVKHGVFAASAKSLLGIMSLDIQEPMTVEIASDDESKLDKFKQWEIK